MSAIIDSFHPDYVLSACDTLDYCEQVFASEQELTRETRDILDSICASVESIVAESSDDFADSLADLDEIFDRFSL